MSWNYQIGKKHSKFVSETFVEGFDEYGIVEVYRDEKGNITSTTKNFVESYGESSDEVIRTLRRMLNDSTTREVLDLDKLWKGLEESSINLKEGE